MEKYIKPECKIVEVKFEGNLMQASNICLTLKKVDS